MSDYTLYMTDTSPLIVEITVPEGSTPGSVLAIPHPHGGQVIQLVVPSGAPPGSKLQIDVNDAARRSPNAAPQLTSAQADSVAKAQIPFTVAVQNQCGALVLKNCRVLSRRPFMMMQFILFPLLTILLLSAFNAGLNDEQRVKPLPVEGITVSIPTKCSYFVAEGRTCIVDTSRATSCITLAYAPSPNAKADAIIKTFADAADFTVTTATSYSPNEALSEQYVLPSFDIVGVATKVDLASLVVDHYPHIDATVVFDLEEDPDGLTFEIWINHTRTACYARVEDPFHYVALHQSLSSAAIQEHVGKRVDTKATLAPFPDAKDEAGLTTVSYPTSLVPWAGGMFIMVGVAGASLVVFNLIADENRNKLVTSMRMMVSKS